MKRILLFLLTISCLFALTSCSLNKYEEEAGVYNLYYIDFEMDEGNIDIDTNIYEYARITLYSNGFYLIEEKSYDSQAQSQLGTYFIEDGKIHFGTVLSIFTGALVCDYVDGEIHVPKTSLFGMTFAAKFKRN